MNHNSLATLFPSKQSPVSTDSTCKRSHEESGSPSPMSARPSKRARTNEVDDSIIIAKEDALPLPKDHAAMSPDDYLKLLVQALSGGKSVRTRGAAELNAADYFREVSDEQRAAYTTELTSLARAHQMDALKAYCDAKPIAAAAANRFGESLLHMACRRGFQDMTEYLLSFQEHVSVRVADDGGRTPLHDACWNPTPQTEIASRLVTADASLLLISDKRGFTPFQYARPQYWSAWRDFLYDHRESLRTLASMDEFTSTTKTVQIEQ